MKIKFFLKIYNGLWYLCLPLVLGYLWWKGRKLPAYHARIAERFAWNTHVQPVDIWIHAVSLGEVIAASPIIAFYLTQGKRILVTSMTPTGSVQILRAWGQQVLHQYCPYDIRSFWKRFLQAYQPRVCVLMETELWPNLIEVCAQQQIAIILLNARISNRSYGRYLRTKFLWQYLFTKFTGIYVQSDQDLQRFLSLGAPRNVLFLAGNLKFHGQDLSKNLEAWKNFKSCYDHRKIVVFGSTHPGEEAIILEAWKVFKHRHPEWLAILVPRHPERFETVLQLMQQMDPHAQVTLYSQWTAQCQDVDYVLLNVMGELAAAYSIADLAFVGGSLVPIGGHNVLEPMRFGVPVICGHYMHNQQDLLSILRAAHAIVVVQNGHELLSQLLKLNDDAVYRQQLIAQSHKTLEQHQHVVNICVQGIQNCL